MHVTRRLTDHLAPTPQEPSTTLHSSTAVSTDSREAPTSASDVKDVFVHIEHHARHDVRDRRVVCRDAGMGEPDSAQATNSFGQTRRCTPEAVHKSPKCEVRTHPQAEPELMSAEKALIR